MKGKRKRGEGNQKGRGREKEGIIERKEGNRKRREEKK